MTPEQLKASIFQCALQGKLVEQRIEEGNAESLYQSLLVAKEKLIKNKLILKKADTVPFYEEEYPFDIPETWKWVQLSEVSIIQEGAGIRKFQYRDSGTQILCVTNILDGSIDLEKKKLYIDTDEYKEKYIHLTLNKGDIVTSCSGGSWGKISFFNEDETLMLNTSTLRMRFFDDLADNEYLYYVCQSSLFKNQLTEQLSGMQPNFGYAHYSRICFPLPPLEEQHRIVEQLKKTLPFILRYSEAYEKLEQFNAKFPEDMKKSILQYAIQGKLVEQRPEEGTAEDLYKAIQEEKQKLIKEGKIKKEKPLAEITEDEIPFDIPDSWKWVRLSTIGITQTGNTPKKSHPEYFGHDIPFLGPGDIQNSLINYENQGLSDEGKEYGRITPADSILQVCIGGSIGKCALVDREVTFNQQINSIYPIIANSEYVYHILDSSYFKNYMRDNAGGTATPIINRGLWDAITIPLPPLKEQERIVTKIKELLPYCERLMK